MEADQSRDDSSTSSPDTFPPENPDNSVAHDGGHNPPGLSNVIPNRIFVGGFDFRVDEGDLRHVFSQHGAVTEVNIVLDRSGTSKGYGFVTFENRDDALKVLHRTKGIYCRDKKLFIGQAVRRQQGQRPVPCRDLAVPLLTSPGTEYQTASTGYPYTYHNGAAYFHYLNLNPAALVWPQPARPLMPVYQQPAACQYYQCVPNQNQWNYVQMPSSPVVYPQQSDYLCPPADGGSAHPPPPVVGDTSAEFSERPQRAEGTSALVLQPRPTHVGPLSRVQLKPQCRPQTHQQERSCLPETSEPEDAAVLRSAPPSV